MALDKKPNFQEIESNIRKFWDKQRIYSYNPKSKKPVYSVDMPPPTISGDLHIGHAFSYNQAEFMVRYKRMRGFEVFYPMGFDNNGLATELLTERTKKVQAEDMPREKFIKLVFEVEKEGRERYSEVWRTLGISCDWSQLYTTIEPKVQKLSQKTFINLYKQGRAVRLEAPVLWCPKCSTALAQAELEDKERDSVFSFINFKSETGNVTIATTRPELLASCVAVFVNPEDSKNKKLIGKTLTVPLFNQKVKVLSDERADPEKGTGIVMCCTFGDQTDIEWFKAHKLPLKIAINSKGVMTDLAGKYKGLKIEEARKKILEDLKKGGYVVKQKPITQSVNVHERCGTPIEFLVTKQWYIRYLNLKKQFLEQANKIKWYPKHMKVRYDNWVKGLQWDWCISRQRYYGIPFPVWYCKKCSEVVLASEDMLPVDPLQTSPGKCPKCKSKDLEPEHDIIDTWFTSGLTPTINEVYAGHKFVPMDLRPQAHDIITFWAFYTIAQHYMNFKKIPFKNIMISGHAQDPHGKKMSKSKGNVIYPLEIAKKYSADAVRWWAASSKLGDDMPYQEKDVATGLKIAIKLWNVARFLEQYFKTNIKKPKTFEIEDRWILTKLNEVIKTATDYFEEYAYSKAKFPIEQFFWKDLADNYLEMVKHRIYSEDSKTKDSAIYSLYVVYNSILKLFAPFIPFVTEEIYQNLFASKENIKSIHISEWPPLVTGFDKKKDLELGELAKELVSELRKWKQANNIRLGAEVESLTIRHSKDIKALKSLLEGTLRIKNLTVKKGEFVISA